MKMDSKQLQQAIALLEVIFAIADNDEPDDEPLCSFPKIKKLASQALAILQQPKAQPTEFTKKTRERYVNVTGGYWPSKVMYEKRVADLCDRLDTSKASREELLDACKELIKNEPHGITPYFDKALRRIEAAISNAGG